MYHNICVHSRNLISCFCLQLHVRCVVMNLKTGNDSRPVRDGNKLDCNPIHNWHVRVLIVISFFILSF